MPKMKNLNNNTLSWVIGIALLLILGSALLPVLNINWAATRYIFAAGAVVTLVARLLIKYPETTPRIKRLHRIENVSAMCYCVAAFFLFYPEAGPSDWLGFLTAGAALQIYAAFTIDYLEKRDKKKQ